MDYEHENEKTSVLLCLGHDPERDPEAAAVLADLLAGGAYVEASVSCGNCGGSFGGLFHRAKVAQMTSRCIGCLSENVTVLVVDPTE